MIKGFKAWKNYLGPKLTNGGNFCPNPNSGQPDIFGIMNDGTGRLFGIEVKTEIGKLSDKQKKEIRELETAGALMIIARDLQTVIDAMEGAKIEANKNQIGSYRNPQRVEHQKNDVNQRFEHSKSIYINGRAPTSNRYKRATPACFRP